MQTSFSLETSYKNGNSSGLQNFEVSLPIACEEIHFKSCSEEDIAEVDSNDDEESNDIGEETGQQPTEQTQSSATSFGGAVSVFLVLFSSIANFI